MKWIYVGIDLLYDALPALLDSSNEILKIFTCDTDNKTEFNTKTIAFAKQHQIPYSLARLTKEMLLEFQQDGADGLICAGCYYKLPVLLDFPMLNIHPTYLPYGRGVWPMPIYILEERVTSGISIHKLTESFDSGDIVLQASCPLSPNETHFSYMKKVCSLLPPMIQTLSENFWTLYTSATPQSKGEYLPCPQKSDYTITAQHTLAEADKILRAFSGYECYYQQEQNIVEITNGFASLNTRPGFQAFPVQNGYILVKKESQ